ncbi:MAG TPA: hypothetical protein VII61_20730, partial [Ktedonobacteraceae bacterium]
CFILAGRCPPVPSRVQMKSVTTLPVEEEYRSWNVAATACQDETRCCYGCIAGFSQGKKR